MLLINNPFVTSGYIAPEYFCDREKETEELLRWLLNENNVATISTRRMRKTGLIQHCPNARFIFAGSQRHLMGEMFISPPRPFYQSVSYSFTYSELLYQLPEKQKELLIAICKEGKATALTSGKFIHKYSLPSSSSVQSALKGLLEKDFVTKEGAFYMGYDRFFSLWLKCNF